MVEHVEPLFVAVIAGNVLVLGEPFINIEFVILLRPEHARQRLPHDRSLFRAGPVRHKLRIKCIGFTSASVDHCIKVVAQRAVIFGVRLLKFGWGDPAEP